MYLINTVAKNLFAATNNANQKSRTFFYALLAITLSQIPVFAQDVKSTGSLESVLDKTGRIKSGVNGSFNPAGYTMQTGANGEPIFLPETKNATPIFENIGGTPNGALYGNINAIVVSGTDVYFAGGFEFICGVAANRIAKWNGSSWSALGSGLDGTVNAIAVSGSNVYVGGAFTSAGGVANTAKIAHWDGTQWNALGTGLNDDVNALAIMGTEVYAGGLFTTAGGITNANRIARWNGTAWNAVGTGISNGAVLALAAAGTSVYVAGSFTDAGGNTSADRIARWSGTAWVAMGSGIGNNSVYALAVSGTNVYAGGNFTSAGGISANRIAWWRGSSWATLGSGAPNGIVNAIALSGTDLYVGGTFTSMGGDANAVRSATWNGTAWSALSTGMPTAAVQTVAVYDSKIWFGGSFLKAGGVTANHLATWDGTSFSSVGNGISSSVNQVFWTGSELYAVGFNSVGGSEVNGIAKWNGTNWSGLGSGVTGNTFIYSVAVSGNDIYIGGSFTNAGGVAGTARIARWNGSSWNAVGSGIPDGAVRKIVISGSEVIVGGSFTSAGGVGNTSKIAKWDGRDWSSIGTGGSGGDVFELFVQGGDLYAGGTFTSMGGIAGTQRIAKWNGTTWSAMGTGIAANAVYAVYATETDVYVGGNFTSVASLSNTAGIARWNGTEWSAMGSGLNNYVYTIKPYDGKLYAGGSMTASGATVLTNLAVWDGTSWSAFSNAFTDQINSFDVGSEGLYAGGFFMNVDGSPVAHVSYMKLSPPAPSKLAATITKPSPLRELEEFSVQVNAVDAGNTPQNTTAATQITLSASGGGTLHGTLTRTIPQGSSTVTFTGISYSQANASLQITASVTSGPALTAITTSAFAVTALVNEQNEVSTGTYTTINMNADVTLTGTVMVTGTLDLGGKITTGTDTLKLGPNAELRETATNYVVGKVKSVREPQGGNVNFGGLGVSLSSKPGQATLTAPVDVTRKRGPEAVQVVGGKETLPLSFQIKPSQSGGEIPPVKTDFVIPGAMITEVPQNAPPVKSMKIIVSSPASISQVHHQSVSPIVLTLSETGQTVGQIKVMLRKAESNQKVRKSGGMHSLMNIDEEGAEVHFIADTNLAATKFVATVTKPSMLYPGGAFSVLVQATDTNGVPTNIVADTDISLSILGGGSLSGTLTRTMLAETNSINFTGLSFAGINSSLRIIAADAFDEFEADTAAAFTVESPIVINEVHADSPGADAAEFVELFSNTGNFSLTGYSLVLFDATTGLSVGAHSLDGLSTDASGYFVFGNAGLSGISARVTANSGKILSSESLLNAGAAVALYNAEAGSFPNGTAVTTANLFDALVYTVNGASTTSLSGLLLGGQNAVDDANETTSSKDVFSMQRIPNGSGGYRKTETYLNTYPTPGAENKLSAYLAQETGWRMMSVPANTTFASFFENVWTQGFAGANTSSGVSNVYRYVNGNWVTPASLSSAIPPGSGFIFLAFPDDDVSTPGIQGGFPKVLPISAAPSSESIVASLQAGEGAYSLLGNPFSFPISWNGLAGSRSGITNVVYTYDPEYAPGEGASGAFRSYNGSVGSLASGIVAPFQGFIIESLGGSPSLTFPASSKSTGGQFFGKSEAENVFKMRFIVSGAGLSNDAWLQFSPQGSEEFDAWDARKMAPLTSQFLAVSTGRIGGKGLDINHLPLRFELLEIPLDVKTTISGSFTLKISDFSVPEGWIVEISDRQTGKRQVLPAEAAFTFVQSKNAVSKATGTPVLEHLSVDDEPRFTLHIIPSVGTFSESIKLPTVMALAQNFPNPFNPMTTINFSTPQAGEVKLTVMNMIGQTVAVVKNEILPAGHHSVAFDASKLASGVYLYRLSAGNQIITRKMTLLK